VALTRARWIRLALILLLAAGLRLGLLAAGVVPFNADEAVVGLMARHVLQGERPIFFYGQAYLGSLDAWLVAGAFVIFGQSVVAIRLVQIILYLGILATTYLLGLRIFRSDWIAAAAALLLALPPVLFTLYSTVTLGGYGEALLIGNLLLLLALRLLAQGAGQIHRPGWLLLGLLAGVGFWTFPLVLVYAVPIAVAAVLVGRRRPAVLAGQVVLAAVGFAAGSAPWSAYTLVHGGVTLAETGGQAIAGASPGTALAAVSQHALYFALFGLTAAWGLRPPWSATLLAIALAPLALAVNLAVVVFAARGTLQRHDDAWLGRWLLAGTCVTLAAAFIFTPFGADPSGRYFLPLAAPLALFIAEMLNHLRQQPGRRWLGQSLALGLLAFNGWGTLQSAAAFPPGLTTQFDAATQIDQRAVPQVAAFLRAHGETRGYTNYWVEYPLAFLSQDDLLFVARLPYHPDLRYTTRDDRYAPYDAAVAASPRAAYITARLPELDTRLRSDLARLGVRYSEAVIGDFHIYYGLSRKVTPDELTWPR
jgi:4-amino-4-deoxy-L-arabinose transferase-like glycosyltransferase